VVILSNSFYTASTALPAGTLIYCGFVNGQRTTNCNGVGKSKKGLLGLLGLLGLIPLLLAILLCCLCLLRKKRRGQAMMFSVTHAPAPAPLVAEPAFVGVPGPIVGAPGPIGWPHP